MPLFKLLQPISDALRPERILPTDACFAEALDRTKIWMETFIREELIRISQEPGNFSFEDLSAGLSSFAALWIGDRFGGPSLQLNRQDSEVIVKLFIDIAEKAVSQMLHLNDAERQIVSQTFTEWRDSLQAWQRILTDKLLKQLPDSSILFRLSIQSLGSSHAIQGKLSYKPLSLRLWNAGFCAVAESNDKAKIWADVTFRFSNRESLNLAVSFLSLAQVQSVDLVLCLAYCTLPEKDRKTLLGEESSDVMRVAHLIRNKPNARDIMDRVIAFNFLQRNEQSLTNAQRSGSCAAKSQQLWLKYAGLEKLTDSRRFEILALLDLLATNLLHQITLSGENASPLYRVRSWLAQTSAIHRWMKAHILERSQECLVLRASALVSSECTDVVLQDEPWQVSADDLHGLLQKFEAEPLQHSDRSIFECKTPNQRDAVKKKIEKLLKTGEVVRTRTQVPDDDVLWHPANQAIAPIEGWQASLTLFNHFIHFERVEEKIQASFQVVRGKKVAKVANPDVASIFAQLRGYILKSLQCWPRMGPKEDWASFEELVNALPDNWKVESTGQFPIGPLFYRYIEEHQLKILFAEEDIKELDKPVDPNKTIPEQAASFIRAIAGSRGTPVAWQQLAECLKEAERWLQPSANDFSRRLRKGTLHELDLGEGTVRRAVPSLRDTMEIDEPQPPCFLGLQRTFNSAYAMDSAGLSLLLESAAAHPDPLDILKDLALWSNPVSNRLSEDDPDRDWFRLAGERGLVNWAQNVTLRCPNTLLSEEQVHSFNSITMRILSRDVRRPETLFLWERWAEMIEVLYLKNTELASVFFAMKVNLVLQQPNCTSLIQSPQSLFGSNDSCLMYLNVERDRRILEKAVSLLYGARRRARVRNPERFTIEQQGRDVGVDLKTLTQWRLCDSSRFRRELEVCLQEQRVPFGWKWNQDRLHYSPQGTVQATLRPTHDHFELEWWSDIDCKFHAGILRTARECTWLGHVRSQLSWHPDITGPLIAARLSPLMLDRRVIVEMGSPSTLGSMKWCEMRDMLPGIFHHADRFFTEDDSFGFGVVKAFDLDEVVRLELPKEGKNSPLVKLPGQDPIAISQKISKNNLHILFDDKTGRGILQDLFWNDRPMQVSVQRLSDECTVTTQNGWTFARQHFGDYSEPIRQVIQQLQGHTTLIAEPIARGHYRGLFLGLVVPSDDRLDFRGVTGGRGKALFLVQNSMGILELEEEQSPHDIIRFLTPTAAWAPQLAQRLLVILAQSQPDLTPAQFHELSSNLRSLSANSSILSKGLYQHLSRFFSIGQLENMVKKNPQLHLIPWPEKCEAPSLVAAVDGCLLISRPTYKPPIERQQVAAGALAGSLDPLCWIPNGNIDDIRQSGRIQLMQESNRSFVQNLIAGLRDRLFALTLQERTSLAARCGLDCTRMFLHLLCAQAQMEKHYFKGYMPEVAPETSLILRDLCCLAHAIVRQCHLDRLAELISGETDWVESLFAESAPQTESYAKELTTLWESVQQDEVSYQRDINLVSSGNYLSWIFQRRLFELLRSVQIRPEQNRLLSTLGTEMKDGDVWLVEAKTGSGKTSLVNPLAALYQARVGARVTPAASPKHKGFFFSIIPDALAEAAKKLTHGVGTTLFDGPLPFMRGNLKKEHNWLNQLIRTDDLIAFPITLTASTWHFAWLKALHSLMAPTSTEQDRRSGAALCRRLMASSILVDEADELLQTDQSYNLTIEAPQPLPREMSRALKCLVEFWKHDSSRRPSSPLHSEDLKRMIRTLMPDQGADVYDYLTGVFTHEEPCRATLEIPREVVFMTWLARQVGPTVCNMRFNRDFGPSHAASLDVVPYVKAHWPSNQKFSNPGLESLLMLEMASEPDFWNIDRTKAVLSLFSSLCLDLQEEPSVVLGETFDKKWWHDPHACWETLQQSEAGHRLRLTFGLLLVDQQVTVRGKVLRSYASGTLLRSQRAIASTGTPPSKAEMPSSVGRHEVLQTGSDEQFDLARAKTIRAESLEKALESQAYQIVLDPTGLLNEENAIRVLDLLANKLNAEKANKCIRLTWSQGSTDAPPALRQVLGNQLVPPPSQSEIRRRPKVVVYQQAQCRGEHLDPGADPEHALLYLEEALPRRDLLQTIGRLRGLRRLTSSTDQEGSQFLTIAMSSALYAQAVRGGRSPSEGLEKLAQELEENRQAKVQRSLLEQELISLKQLAFVVNQVRVVLGQDQSGSPLSHGAGSLESSLFSSFQFPQMADLVKSDSIESTIRNRKEELLKEGVDLITLIDSEVQGSHSRQDNYMLNLLKRRIGLWEAKLRGSPDAIWTRGKWLDGEEIEKETVLQCELAQERQEETDQFMECPGDEASCPSTPIQSVFWENGEFKGFASGPTYLENAGLSECGNIQARLGATDGEPLLESYSPDQPVRVSPAAFRPFGHNLPLRSPRRIPPLLMLLRQSEELQAYLIAPQEASAFRDIPQWGRWTEEKRVHLFTLWGTRLGGAMGSGEDFADEAALRGDLQMQQHLKICLGSLRKVQAFFGVPLPDISQTEELKELAIWARANPFWHRLWVAASPEKLRPRTQFVLEQILESEGPSAAARSESPRPSAAARSESPGAKDVAMSESPKPASADLSRKRSLDFGTADEEAERGAPNLKRAAIARELPNEGTSGASPFVGLFDTGFTDELMEPGLQVDDDSESEAWGNLW